ncbi:hypothetical protein JCM10212_003076 [Sporobolomyces blumeae]
MIRRLPDPHQPAQPSPAPLRSFRLPSNPFPTSPLKSAPSTPLATPRAAYSEPRHVLEYEPFVASPIPLPVRRAVPPPAVLNLMSSTSSRVDSDVEFEQFRRDGSSSSHVSDATYDGFAHYDDCPPIDAYYSSPMLHSSESTETFSRSRRVADCPMSQETLGKRSWADVQYSDDASYQYTPSSRSKRIRVEPVTPITPSSSSYLSAPLEGGYVSSGMPVARTLSYGADGGYSRSTSSYNDFGDELRPTSSHSRLSYEGGYVHDGTGFERSRYPNDASFPTAMSSISSSPSETTTPFLTCTTAASSYFEALPADDYHHDEGLLASPLLIPQSAPIERGHFQPYPDVESAGMAVSYSLPQPPPQYLTPRRGRTIHCKRDADYLYTSPLSTPHRSYPDAQFQLQSPVSPNAACPPALVPIPASSTPPSISRRSSNASNYTPNQAALVSAASMNRLLSRFPPSNSPQSNGIAQPIVSKGPAVSAIHPRYREPPPPRTVPSSPAKVEKMHTCHEHGCGKRFKRLEHLKRHERTHTLEKPYGCDIPGCGRYFSRSDNLAQHRKTHDRNGKTSRAMAAANAAREAAARAAEAAAMAGPY